MTTNVLSGPSRRTSPVACMAIALGLTACSEGGSEPPGSTSQEPAGQDLGGNPMATAPFGGSGGGDDIASDDPFGSSSTSTGTFGQATEGSTVPFGGGNGNGQIGGGVEFEFDCGDGLTVLAGPGGTFTCGGITYEVDEAGNAEPVGDDAGGDSFGGNGLAAALANDVVSEDEFDYWLCDVDAHDYPVGYFFDASGTGFSLHLDEETFGGDFEWSVGADDATASLDYTEIGAIEELNAFELQDGSSFRAFSSSEGDMDCERRFAGP